MDRHRGGPRHMAFRHVPDKHRRWVGDPAFGLVGLHQSGQQNRHNYTSAANHLCYVGQLGVEIIFENCNWSA